MPQEAVLALKASEGGLFVDGTLGLGGHTEAILKASPEARVIALEWNQASLELARRRLASYGDRVVFELRNFARVDEVLEELGVREVKGMILDLGLSSFLIEGSGRGFSFLKEEPLDMRMDEGLKITAKDLVNRLSEAELAKLIFRLGEERFARRIAKAIVRARQRHPVENTKDLAEIISRAVPSWYRHRRRHPATKTFQALRLAVNRELDNLNRFLEKAPDFLTSGGRLVIISFHSLEDRLVKHHFRRDPRLKVINKKPLRPSSEEVARNPRARSAKMRVAERVREVDHG
ncbi:16S rRNA (cytosine(1402)-N(4))-methyltransferase RsmH [Thermosulfuriphilus ammonigenes]|uniref:Ribosomal RNA small subunit methyltransferase H n=1 Tax=Thermosulfuriphilus ammonigenes TaxID=1936021 RepID=A0A6G7PYH3_9BACT|nr:16S rRNA (cytosine(1402)-N(4))-methyltransferase RsmH [Thermosulfuriphilus ammonigenes]MBA2849428.1 16S rRNA (cytosine1402-N4)-methyltransferase [Thermosulfuriphilus ammonigenes]QIJ72498.1 16S rRNA (cytosine(1402)-N(4))-methyltransferase RsmH [Thermosulfuriphilus ammonigenes]HFB84125.1 16S rRNA (cytosine(1402)-N(4))-methyltransferase RsmH [Thermodesulfatator sp.]